MRVKYHGKMTTKMGKLLGPAGVVEKDDSEYVAIIDLKSVCISRM